MKGTGGFDLGRFPPQQSPSSTPDHSPRLPSSDVPSSSLQRRLANSPTTREAVASMLSMGGGTVPLPEPEPSRRKSSRSRKRKRRESFDVEDDDEDFQDAAMSQVYQDDEFVYPSLDVSDEEEESVKPKSPVKRKKKSQSGRRRKGIVQAHEKEDTAWNPHNRISVSSPRNKREGRPGAKREAVERGLMEAREHGRRRKSQSRKLPSKSSSKRESFPSSSSNAKGRDHSPTHSWSPSALSPPSSETPPQGSSFHPSSPQASPQETSSAPDDPTGAAAGVNFAKDDGVLNERLNLSHNAFLDWQGKSASALQISSGQLVIFVLFPLSETVHETWLAQSSRFRFRSAVSSKFVMTRWNEIYPVDDKSRKPFQKRQERKRKAWKRGGTYSLGISSDLVCDDKEDGDERLYLFSKEDLAESSDEEVCMTFSSKRSLNSDHNVVVKPVEPGDTLQNLSVRFNCSVAELKRVNGLISEQEFFALSTIRIPTAPHSVLQDLIPVFAPSLASAGYPVPDSGAVVAGGSAPATSLLFVCREREGRRWLARARVDGWNVEGKGKEKRLLPKNAEMLLFLNQNIPPAFGIGKIECPPDFGDGD
ncbi:unnamed protein product [Cyprideis torosa]|uniref:Uncharacterized protein n=1 Tax=Cyprideis torosa TaxID=163714 RepID=A0A7R8ZQ31_9CRUS|nr:unnamed protein product [Cyprideis torosa]CAG0891202.1 unnamed protein product [Cyprideis torosa]